MASDPKKSDKPEAPELPTATYEVWHSLSHDNEIFKRGQLIALPVDKAAPLVASGVLVALGTAALLAQIEHSPVAPIAIVPVAV